MGRTVRPATPGDEARVAALLAAVEEKLVGHSVFTEDDVLGWWQTVPYETNTWLFEEGDKLLAAAGGQVFGDRGNGAGGVHPDAWGQGLGTRLVELLEERLRADGAKRIHSWTVSADAGAAELLASHGYREVRRFWDMAIDFEAPTPEPAVAIEVFRDEDGPAFHAAIEEAFEDHWEPHPEPFDSWWERQQARSNFDPSLWFLVRDGGELAAVCRSEMRPNGGYVGALGVRRPWRGKGLGRALLQHTFREFRRRGATHASLGVDAANPTGATRLYESVGMHVAAENTVWEKILA